MNQKMMQAYRAEKSSTFLRKSNFLKLNYYKFLLSLIIVSAGAVIAYSEEEVTTEKATSVWAPRVKMTQENVKVGKYAASSGVINGNYPTFSLRIPQTDMTARDATLSFFWRANTNAPDWSPQVRLYSSGSNGFFHWSPPGGRRNGNMGWQRVDLKVRDMRTYKKVDLRNIYKIMFVGDHIISSGGLRPQIEFFIDGLSFKANGKRLVLREDKPQYGLMHSSVPADVKHPTLMYKTVDIVRAQENIKLHAWARKLLDSQRKAAEFWMNCPDDKIAFWIPEEGGINCCCPKCHFFATLKSNSDYTGLVCAKCGEKFPSEKYRENKFDVITTPTGKKKKIYYYQGPDQFINAENIGSKYHISMALNWYKLLKTRYNLLPVAYVYALEGNIKYAAKVRKVLLRFAEVYPDYVPKWRATTYPAYGEHLMAGKVQAWKIHDSFFIICLAQAYDLTYNSGLYTAEDKVKIENGIFREYKKLICSTDPPLTDWTVNGDPFHYTASVYSAMLLGDHDFLRLALESPRGFKWFIRSYFKRDGSSLELSPAYNLMSLKPLFKLVNTIEGYSDPPSYKGKDAYRNLNIFSILPELKILYRSVAYTIMPNGHALPVGDSDLTISYPVNYAEINYKWDPTEENRQLLSLTAKGGMLSSMFALFYRDPNFTVEKHVKFPWYMTSSLLLPGRQCAILRDSSTARPETALAVYYPGRVGHGHNDTLNFIYYNFARELVTDLGYLGAQHFLAPWLQSTLTHNLVIVDGKAQSKSRRAKLNFFSGNFPAKAVSAEATGIYPGVSQYRRTMFMMNRSAGQSYVVDLFSVKGGNRHSYVFHADGEKILLPKLSFTEIGAEKLGEPAIGTKYLSDVHLAKTDKDLSCSWISDKDKEKITTVLHLLNDQNAEFIYMQGPGLRNRNTPFAKVKLFPIILRRKGPNNNFISVIEAFKGKSFIDKIKKLDAGNKDIAALEIISGKYKDIIIINNSGYDKEVKLAEYPNFRFHGKLGVVSLKDGKLDALYMVGGSLLSWNNSRLIGAPQIRGKVESFDQKTFAVKTSISAMPKFDCKGEYMFFDSQFDGGYRIEKMADNGIITLNKCEIFRFKRGDKFTIIPTYYKKFDKSIRN